MTYTVSEFDALARRHLGDAAGVVEKNGRVVLKTHKGWGSPVKLEQIDKLFRHISVRLIDGIGERFERDVEAKIAELKSELEGDKQ